MESMVCSNWKVRISKFIKDVKKSEFKEQKVFMEQMFATTTVTILTKVYTSPKTKRAVLNKN